MVFLDEATSALDEQNEAKLYAWLKAAALDAYVSVGHRASLFRSVSQSVSQRAAHAVGRKNDRVRPFRCRFGVWCRCFSCFFASCVSWCFLCACNTATIFVRVCVCVCVCVCWVSRCLLFLCVRLMIAVLPTMLIFRERIGQSCV